MHARLPDNTPPNSNHQRIPGGFHARFPTWSGTRGEPGGGIGHQCTTRRPPVTPTYPNGPYPATPGWNALRTYSRPRTSEDNTHAQRAQRIRCVCTGDRIVSVPAVHGRLPRRCRLMDIRREGNHQPDDRVVREQRAVPAHGQRDDRSGDESGRKQPVEEAAVKSQMRTGFMTTLRGARAGLRHLTTGVSRSRPYSGFAPPVVAPAFSERIVMLDVPRASTRRHVRS